MGHSIIAQFLSIMCQGLVTGQSLPPKNDFEHARGPRNSTYVVNLAIRQKYRHISRETSIEHRGLANKTKHKTKDNYKLRPVQSIWLSVILGGEAEKLPHLISCRSGSHE